MPKDIREMLENYPEEKGNLSVNHATRFEDKLRKELHREKPKRQTYKWLSIAASIALLVSIAIQFYPEKNVEVIPTEIQKSDQKISLGSISPELNTIERYYTNSINLELSKLELTEQNQEILDSYLNKIKELTTDYKTLTLELNTKGVNDGTIDALISNLQLRLQLLKRLKSN
ncbi:MAG: hypothetical protein JKY02_08020 [Flavobacteriaceae bacterium]|nr:hypothetical protein [Flavobacteriaceae bacterium]